MGVIEPGKKINYKLKVDETQTFKKMTMNQKSCRHNVYYCLYYLLLFGIDIAIDLRITPNYVALMTIKKKGPPKTEIPLNVCNFFPRICK